MKLKIAGKIISYDDFVKDIKDWELNTQSPYEFENSLYVAYYDAKNKADKIRPTKPYEPEKPKPYQVITEFIPSYHGSYDGEHKESYIYKNEKEKQRDQEKYEVDLEKFKVAKQQYDKDLKVYENSDEYKNFKEIEAIRSKYLSAIQIPEWREVHTYFIDALVQAKNSGSKSPGLERLAELAAKINGDSHYTPEQKIAALTDQVLKEYRHLLRGGATGFFKMETKSILGRYLQEFCKETLNIELPTSLAAGKKLSIDSLTKDGKINREIFDAMTENNNKTPKPRP